jgi:DNA (cytosine-5)-methyltransferase 1
MPRQKTLFDELIIDNFAGGGGASTGIELATGKPVDIAINHDESAIAMHKANHPYTRHFCESVWEVDPRKVTHGQPVALAWFSPDCKHFSKAKGGKPVNKEIRGLAWVAVRWAATVRPRVIILENVEEFKTWGPVVGGQPDKKRAGRTFNSFVNQLRRLGYAVDWKELRACYYGAPTIRKRFFLVARCDGQPIVFPEPTHAAPDSEAVKSGKLKPWRTAAEIIDWTLPCPSIFESSAEIWEKHGLRAVRPLAEATLRRIARGLKKFVIDNPEPFVVQVNHSGASHHYCNSINQPLKTITAKQGYAIVTPTLIQYHDEQGKNEVRGQSLEKPLLTADAANRYALAAATLIQTGYGEAPGQQPRVPGIDKPLGTAVSTPKHAVVQAFLSKQYGGGYTGAGSGLKEPLHTVTGIDHNALVTSHLDIFRNNEDGQSNSEPLKTIMTNQHFGIVRTFLVKYYSSDDGHDQSINTPLHTITTRDRFGLVTVYGKQYAIIDIGLRMLTPRELFNAQGFPADYIIDIDREGRTISKSAQVARCGNAVPPPFAEALVRANLPELCGKQITSMAKLHEEMAV